MVTMFKIHKGGALSYLNNMIPDKYENITSSYNTRNKHNYFIPRCRLELFKQDVFVKHNAPDNVQFQRRPRSQGQIF